MLTQEYLKSELDYNPETGLFTWKIKRPGVKVGGIAGSKSHDYLRVKLEYKEYLLHRLAWFYVHGVWPKKCIDHINGIKTDNRLCNLREATTQQNNHNIGLSKNNTSGIKGIRWDSRAKKWLARLKLNNKYIFAKYFDDLDEAKKELSEVRRKYHGEFANEG